MPTGGIRLGSDTAAMRIETGFADGSAIVHLTHTALVADALCGEAVAFSGLPDLAVICDECSRLAGAAAVDLAVALRHSPPAGAEAVSLAA